jgi:tetratricopeptide (TPR) repeat protein
LAAVVATNTPVAVSNLAQAQAGISIRVPDPNDPVEKEFQKLEAEDDAAVAEIEKWSDAAATATDAAQAQLSVRLRAKERLDGVKKDYLDFIERHPDYVRARLAFGSFLNQAGDAKGALTQWERASQLAPDNPAVWNNLGNYYEDSNVKKAFEYYSKAIALDPTQPLYYHNLAVCVYMFRTDAAEYWKISEPEVYDKALALYRRAMKLDPDNFILATDYAECFYGIRPQRLQEGLEAWTDCLKIAHDEVEREGVHIHLARFQLALNHFDEARHDLEAVTNKMYATLKSKVASNLDAAVQHALTNGPPQLAR